MSDFWWTADDQLFAKYYNSLKYSVVADLVATLPNSDELHSPLKDVEKSYTHYQTPNYPAAVGRLLQAIRKFYNYIAGGGMQLINRGDNIGYDFSLADLTTDGNWHDLNLSAIAPAGIKAVLLRVAFTTGTPADYIALRKKGNINSINQSTPRLQVAGVYTDLEFIVFVDDDRIIEYQTSATTFSGIYFTVRGWFS